MFGEKGFASELADAIRVKHGENRPTYRKSLPLDEEMLSVSVASGDDLYLGQFSERSKQQAAHIRYLFYSHEDPYCPRFDGYSHWRFLYRER